MAWPPATIAADKAPGPPIDADEHPDHHNELAAAVNELVVKAGALTVAAIDDTDSPYTVLVGDDLIAADASSGAVTVALPAAATLTGRRLDIKRINSAGSDVSIDPNGSETIDGSATTVALTTQYESITIASNGTGWWIL